MIATKYNYLFNNSYAPTSFAATGNYRVYNDPENDAQRHTLI
jgi:hypothetical protein